MDWPDDSFTARRIKDGDVTVFEEPAADQPEGTEGTEGTRTRQTHPDAVQQEQPAPPEANPAEQTRSQKRPR